MTVPETIGASMSGQGIEERFGYMGLDSAAFALLAELGPVFEAHGDAILESFYGAMLSYPETRRFFQDPGVKPKLLVGGKLYLASLTRPSLSPTYFEDQRRASVVQERAGLGPEWTIRLAVMFFSMLAPVVAREFVHEPDKAGRLITAVVGRMAFDVEVMLQSYIERHESGLAHVADELADRSRNLERHLREQEAILRATAARAKAAEELASIATLVTGLAHEIGTPLSVILAHAKMLEPSVSGETALRGLRTIQEQIERISRIIQTLLRMAHPRRERPGRIDLATVIEQTLSFLAAQFEHRTVEVKTDLAQAVCVTGQTERIQQLFLNLFLNAIDAMPEGGELRVELNAADRRALVRVSDKGVGIEPADLAKIFDPFFTTKAAGYGSGLGLMVCKEIVADHGGEIGVTSEVGRGSVFAIALPLAGDDEG